MLDERGEGYARVGEAVPVDRLAGADQRLDVVRDVPDVDVHARRRPVRRRARRRRTPGRRTHRRRTRTGRCRGRRPRRSRRPSRPRPPCRARTGRCRSRAPGHRRRRGRAWSGPRRARRSGRSPSARRGSGGPAAGVWTFATSPAAKISGSDVHSDWSTSTPLSTSSPASSASRVLGTAPTPTMTRSAGRDDAGRGDHGRRGDLGDAVAEGELHALPPVHAREHLAELGAEHAVQRRGLRLDDVHVIAVPARRGGRLEPDPAGAHHDDPPVAGDERGPQPFGVVRRTDVVHVGLVRARNVEAARRRTGREEQAACSRPARRRRGGPRARPGRSRSPRCRAAARRRCRRTRTPRARTPCRGVLAGEEALGQRRPFVRPAAASSPISTTRPVNPSSRSVCAALAPARLAPTMTKVSSESPRAWAPPPRVPPVCPAPRGSTR